MKKEYFITIRLKNDETKTYWFYGTNEDANKATCDLITKHNAAWGTNRSPQDYACMACFMFDMERDRGITDITNYIRFNAKQTEV